jgi:hypothetical protein
MRETVIENYLQQQVRKLGGICAKHVSPGRAGDPDRLVKIPGKPAALCETKRPGKDLEPLQRERQREWEAVGLLCMCASTHLEVDEFLKKVMGQ